MQSEVTQLPLTHRLWAWFEMNRKRALWGAAAAVALILVVAILIWRQGEKAMVAGQAFSIVASPLPSAASASSAQAYLRIANQYPGTQAGIRAQLMAAATLFADGKFDEARVQFERLRERRDRRFMAQALLGIAACLHAQGKTNEALTAYKTVIDTQPGENVLPQAKFSLASLYEATG